MFPKIGCLTIGTEPIRRSSLSVDSENPPQRARVSHFGEDWRRCLHHQYRITAPATINTTILKRCMARSRLRQWCPKRYPALAMKVTQTAAPRKLKIANV